MALFLSMLPLYLFGNLHCIGMCGPLVMMIGKHKYRLMYFLGRTLSFTLAGLIAGSFGALIHLTLKQYYLTAVVCLFTGFIIIVMGTLLLFGLHIPQSKWVAYLMQQANQKMAPLMLKDKPSATFLFGFLTIALPCGQSLLVFSACALTADPITGFFNGFAFALFTSPSLFVAMQAHKFISKSKNTAQRVVAVTAVLVGILTLCRGLAELETIPHWILNPKSRPEFHIVMF